MTIGERIKTRRKEMGLSVDGLAQKLKKNRATIYRYESNDIEKLPANILAPLAEALGVTPAWLMGYGTERAPESSHPKVTRIPLLGVVAAGVPIEAIENIEDYEEIPAEWGTDRDYFALRVKGDSMDPVICDGDRVIVRKQPCIDSGQIAVVMVNGWEATVQMVITTYIHYVDEMRKNAAESVAKIFG